MNAAQITQRVPCWRAFSPVCRQSLPTLTGISELVMLFCDRRLECAAPATVIPACGQMLLRMGCTANHTIALSHSFTFFDT
ncbi:hypothetical protein VP018_002462 [Morganella morganii]|uniref:hypothetical protein n=1 Tax=Morganella morganii TaxID=582 RepID=UPI0011470A61|nr:hypothetical protein [Morganella morganii]EMD0830611.1 hypothetical protein [Morganella morganii]